MAENKLEAVVVAIGTDIKTLRKAVNDKEAGAGITEQQLNEVIQRAKSSIFWAKVCQRIWTHSKKSLRRSLPTNGDTRSGAIID